VQDAEVGEVATTTSSHAEAAAAVATEEGGSGSPVEDAAAAGTASIEGVDGIRIRRRPVTGPAVHYVGPFQFRLENEGNTPRNILEKIVWDKDVEVSQARLCEMLLCYAHASACLNLCFVMCLHWADEGEEALVHVEGAAGGCSSAEGLRWGAQGVVSSDWIACSDCRGQEGFSEPGCS
jgi:hypothetical protein